MTGGGEGGGGGGLLSYRTLVHACAGAAGGAVAMLVFYPLDTVRARRQLGSAPPGHAVRSLKRIALKEGVPALYRGAIPLLQSLCASNFVYFYAFHGLKAAKAKRVPDSQAAALWDLVLAACAGTVNVLLTNPLWVVSTRLRGAGRGGERPPYASLSEGLASEARRGGLAALWAGAGPSLLLVSNPALQFMCYEALKRRLLPATTNNAGARPSPLMAFALGAAAKALATVLTYPLQLLQMQQRHGQGPREGLLAMARRVLHNEGPLGLFRGLEAKLLQTVLTAALMFALYERIAAFVFMVLMSHRRRMSH